MKELTFKEVIANIKEGEVWENENFDISLYKGEVSIRFETTESACGIYIKEKDKFKLRRKEYTFEEAFKAYEEGKEIESCQYRYKKIDNRDYFYSNLSKEWQGDSIDFNLNEIRNKWYINETM